jgi:hypothetical protein
MPRGALATPPSSALVREALDVTGEQFVDAQAVVDEQAHERGRARVVVLGCGEACR